MPTTTLIVTGMQSDDCLRTVMNAIQDLPCINHADVSLATGTANAGRRGIAGTVLVHKVAGAAAAVGTAIPLAYATLAGRKRAMSAIGQTRSGLIEDALVAAACAGIVALAVKRGR